MIKDDGQFLKKIMIKDEFYKIPKWERIAVNWLISWQVRFWIKPASMPMVMVRIFF